MENEGSYISQALGGLRCNHSTCSRHRVCRYGQAPTVDVPRPTTRHLDNKGLVLRYRVLPHPPPPAKHNPKQVYHRFGPQIQPSDGRIPSRSAPEPRTSRRKITWALHGKPTKGGAHFLIRGWILRKNTAATWKPGGYIVVALLQWEGNYTSLHENPPGTAHWCKWARLLTPSVRCGPLRRRPRGGGCQRAIIVPPASARGSGRRRHHDFTIGGTTEARVIIGVGPTKTKGNYRQQSPGHRRHHHLQYNLATLSDPILSSVQRK